MNLFLGAPPHPLLEHDNNTTLLSPLPLPPHPHTPWMAKYLVLVLAGQLQSRIGTWERNQRGAPRLILFLFYEIDRRSKRVARAAAWEISDESAQLSPLQVSDRARLGSMTCRPLVLVFEVRGRGAQGGGPLSWLELFPLPPTPP